MSIFSLADTIGDIKRFRTIIGLVWEEGFAFLLERARLKWGVPIECRIRCFLKMCAGMWQPEPGNEYSVRLRRLLTKLGPSFVKLGQVLSLRPDLLPQELTSELSKLTNQVPPFSFAEVEQIIEKDLGKPIEKVYKQFDKEPLAAASLAQVHKAVLFNGTSVAVKVQRPGIRDIIQKDIHIMAFFARIIEERIPEWKVVRPTLLVKEFAETIGRELDFTIEAVHAKRFETMYKDDKTVKVAQVYKEYSSKNILTMELIEGIPLNDEKAIKLAQIDKKILAQNGVNALLRQVFVEGFFHADPHPGNYFALPGSVFAFVDYGMAGRLMPKDRLELASFFISFLNEDSESAILHLLHIVDSSKATNLASFEHDIDDILHEWYGSKLKDVSLAQTFFRIMESGRRNGVYFPSSFAYLGKSLLTTESMGHALDPEFDFVSQMRPYIQKIIKEELNPLKTKTKMLDQSLDYISYVKTFPEMTMRLLEKLGSGEIGVKINPQELADLEKKISSSGFRRLVMTIVIMILIALGVTYLIQYSALNLQLSFGTFGAGLLIVLLVWLWRK